MCPQYGDLKLHSENGVSFSQPGELLQGTQAGYLFWGFWEFCLEIGPPTLRLPSRGSNTASLVLGINLAVLVCQELCLGHLLLGAHHQDSSLEC